MIRRPTVVRRPVTRTGLPRAARVLAAPVGGLLLYLACAPRTLWWLAPVAFALLAAALHERSRRHAFVVGLLFGLGFYLPLLPWVGIYVGKAPWLALAGFEALLVGLGGVLIAGVGRLPVSPVWAAACWTATEALAARVPFGGFPWGKVGFSQADGPFVRLAAVGGPALVGFAVVLTGFAFTAWLRSAVAAWPARGWRGEPGTRVLAACVVLPLVAAVLCAGWITGAGPPSGPSDGTAHGGANAADEITVAAVQGNVPRLGLEFNAQRRAVLDNHVRRTLQLADDVAAGRVPLPTFVVWPENASDIDPLRNPDAAAVISEAADRIGAPILVGAVLVLPDNQHTANSVIVWEPGQGPTERNDKRRVLPFGEYLPWRPFFRLLSDYADKAGYFVPGDGPGVVQAAGIPVGVEICWEIAFDDLVGDSVHNGAQVLAVPTNNATFGISEMTYQQLAMSRVRAVQYDRAVVVAATSGVSAIIDPDGSELSHTGQFVPAALVERIPLRRTTTLASRLGSVPEWLLAVVGVGAFVSAARADRRRQPANAPVNPELTNSMPTNSMPVHSREDEDG